MMRFRYGHNNMKARDFGEIMFGKRLPFRYLLLLISSIIYSTHKTVPWKLVNYQLFNLRIKVTILCIDLSLSKKECDPLFISLPISFKSLNTFLMKFYELWLSRLSIFLSTYNCFSIDVDNWILFTYTQMCFYCFINSFI